ncbi:MAG: tetratricopeptide repeat protein [Candidatus Omnitrophota bacterium]
MRPSFSKKILLVIAGVFFCFLILEAGLRLGGLILLALEEHRNTASAQKGYYRILCLGESNTAAWGDNSYPAQLEEILNQRNIGIVFSVVNKGKGEINSLYILRQLENNLDRYKPHMVVVMAGINDNYIKYYEGFPDADTFLFQNIKLYKFIRVAYRNLLSKNRGDLFICSNKYRVPASADLYPLAAESGLTSTRGKMSYASHEALLKSAIRLSPDADATYVELGRFYIEENQPDKAEAVLRKAVEINPGSSVAYGMLGVSYRMLKRFRQAESALKRAVALKCDNQDAYLELGWLYKEEGRLTEAKDNFTKVIGLNPKNELSYIGLGACYRSEGAMRKGEVCFRKAVELNPRNCWAYINLGWLYYDEARSIDAEKTFKKAIEACPQNSRVYIELGKFYTEEKSFPLAEQFFRQGISINPSDALAYIRFGLCCRDQGKFFQAEGLFKKAIILSPRNGWAYAELGWLYKSQGRYGEVEGLFKRAMACDPAYDRVYFELGQLYKDRGEFVRSEEMFKKAIALTYRKDRAYMGLISLYEKIGRDEEAKEYRDTLSRLMPGASSPVTDYVYKEIKKSLDKRGIALVCVQYPMRSIQPLKRIFQEQAKRVIFVDNEQVFKEAVKEGAYNEYFFDIYAGDFGHCTRKGNRLLAGNIADTIIREHFSKSDSLPEKQ